MNANKVILALLLICAVGSIGCESHKEAPSQKQPYGGEDTYIDKSLQDAGYDDVRATRDNGVVTLRGKVPSAADEQFAEKIARDRGAAPVSSGISLEPKLDAAPPDPKMVASFSTEANQANLNYAVVRVFFATDRMQSGAQQGLVSFTGDRSDDENLTFGTLDVSIPMHHKIGEIERPFSIWRFEVREDPAKHVVVLTISSKPEAQFFGELSSRVAASTGKEAFVFIHGYDVTFLDAARRAAQLAYDLNFDGAPILYSWPSKGKPAAYPADEATIEWTAPHLKQFLIDVATKSHATTVHLIAHSMGNRALVAAMNSIASERAGLAPMFKEAFLAAPDIDVGVFMQLAATFPRAADHVTLYASSSDKALNLSMKLHRFPRAGDAHNIATVSKIDSIDATAVDLEDSEFLQHSYFSDNRSILSDIHSVMRQYSPPSSRFGMRPNDPSHPRYWIFLP